MEAYDDMFAYLTEMMRLANPDFKIAAALVMAIVG